MSAKAVREVDGKSILARHLPTALGERSSCLSQCRCVAVKSDTDLSALSRSAGESWLANTELVAKPDQLIKRRGKLGLIKVKASLDEADGWIRERMGKQVTVGETTGTLNTFIVEPFVAHSQDEEVYVCIHSTRSCDTILFHHEGGVDIGDVDAKAKKLDVPVGTTPSRESLEQLTAAAPSSIHGLLVDFIVALYKVYVDLYFTYLEINPLVIHDGLVYILDLAAKLDATAEYLCKATWGDVAYPPPFGRDAYPEEAYIADMDAKSGASLKLTVLNPQGRVWTMVAGGGASVIYSDTICDLGFCDQLANYGEYSGAPSESQTFEYAKTILSLMTKEKDDRGKVLIIGGGIANFTNVAATFKGIVRALQQYQQALLEHKVKIFIRRGGPNYQEGLRVISECGGKLGLDMYVFGPETHMTSIVSMALDKIPIPRGPSPEGGNDDAFAGNAGVASAWSSPGLQRASSIASEPGTSEASSASATDSTAASAELAASTAPSPTSLFTAKTRAVVWGMQIRAVQGMLDFDFSCSRSQPSVAAMVYPFTGNHRQKFYWGAKEVFIPVYGKMAEAMEKHPDIDTMISFASLRSAYESTMEVLEFPQIRSVSIIAEGIPENLTRKMIVAASKKNVAIIGPATVGGIKPGCFKIGNTGGMLDNILNSKLYRPGSVAYVSRSGGMSNELNNIISRNTDGVFEGVAIGGDRYPGTTFLYHLLRFHDEPGVQLIVMLGEVGGVEEYEVIEAMKDGRITKPLVSWCIGTCGSFFSSEVQFGHAGSSANSTKETAAAKNKALREAGAHVPSSFEDLGITIQKTFEHLKVDGKIPVRPTVTPQRVPMDYTWAQELGLIRKPASFMSSISDERGQELSYGGMPISHVFKEDLGVGGVLSLLWFQRRLPEYALKYIEMCLMITADHGPAVSGAHNTIVTARAGKDLISSVTSGLLTIGDRFGGALDDSAKLFSEAYDSNQLPMEFVNSMRRQHKLIPGIGHRVKSLNNPDQRVVILRDFALANFPATPLMSYALEVEKITTAKKPNLILNVDGVIATSFVDLLRNCGAFSRQESNEYISSGVLNGFFVLGRTMGFIGHYLDQKRLKQGLYRHPWDDISYINPRDLDRH
ncbi:ATP-citrate synthase-like [Sycon ciliatum]|uniref:ATP-citrate synthase-like n=1 Tax=Sycon ciliatum TaxID=27933 RepID=UPI0031F6CED5